MSRIGLGMLGIVLGLIAGCGSKTGSTVPDAGTEGRRTGARGTADEDRIPCERRVRQQPARDLPLDLLFMVDSSSSMEEEQASLRRELPRMIRVLTTGDREGDGEPDFPAVQDLHLGVVTSDMGLPGIDRTNTTCSAEGDDGRLITEPADVASKPRCRPSYPSFLSFDPARDVAETVARDFGCVATVGLGGCGYEQQLEAVLKALAPADLEADGDGDSNAEPVRFVGADGRLRDHGHGDGANRGFLRSNGILGLVLVTDEDDCSSRNLSHFQYNLPRNHPMIEHCPEPTRGINTRCVCDWVKQNHLWPVERYLNGLRALKRGRGRIVFTAIAGVPPYLVDEPARRSHGELDTPADRQAFYEDILAHPRMQEVVSEDSRGTNNPVLVPACETDAGAAAPARRIVELAKRFDARATVQSICNRDFGNAIDAIVQLLGDTLTTVSCEPVVGE